MLGGTSNKVLASQMQTNQSQNFKTMNNLLTLQENHVEEFFQYHGVDFMTAIEKLMEDVVERVVSQMLVKLQLKAEGTSGIMSVTADSLREYESITQENIDLDIQMILNSAVNSEVIMQRKMAKSSYLESQGYGQESGQMTGNMPIQQITQANNIQGNPQMGGMGQQMQQQQMAMNNQSGYPIAPTGYDQYNNPYWTDPQTGQMTYSPPESGLGLVKTAGKVAAWAKWLA
tara:strand:+ start:1403 stop:2092 length:690 start_codon:yes stop_codon:yes gene_type:complete